LQCEYLSADNSKKLCKLCNCLLVKPMSNNALVWAFFNLVVFSSLSLFSL
jgi:hypothetical protein